MAWLPRNVLMEMGFASLGENVLISDKAAVYNCAKIAVGNNVRIDDFCVISGGEGGVEIGDHVHVAVYVSLIGAGKITLSDFSGLSSRVAVYSSNDDYSGAVLTGPTVPCCYSNVSHQDVFIGRHVIIGSGSVILPGIKLEDGVAIGALSLVNRDCAEFGIYVGNPAKRVKERKRDLLNVEKSFLASSC